VGFEVREPLTLTLSIHRLSPSTGYSSASISRRHASRAAASMAALTAGRWHSPGTATSTTLARTSSTGCAC